jgi:hypothetical protein
VSIPVTFNGLSVNVPENGDPGWGPDVTALLVELANNAAVVSSLTQNIRVSTSTPTTVLTTDFGVGVNVASASVVNLPAGASSIGQLFFIYDASGTAQTNAITVTPNGSDTVQGAASYVIRTNYGGVFLTFDNTTWQVLSEVRSDLRTPVRTLQGTNASYVAGGITGVSAFPSVSDLQTSTVTLSGSNAYQFIVSLDSGESFVGFTSFNASAISALSDPDGVFLTSDAGTGVYVSKSPGSAVLSVKNRMGSSKNIEVKTLTTAISTSTAWS